MYNHESTACTHDFAFACTQALSLSSNECKNSRASTPDKISNCGRVGSVSTGRGTTPIIHLNAHELKQPTKFRVDTEPEVNLVNYKALESRIFISNHEAMSVTGITQDSINTVGLVEITFFYRPIKFQEITQNIP